MSVPTIYTADFSKNNRPHTCLDPFRADPRLMRIWRVLWNYLPAYIRREKLMLMYKASYDQFVADGDPSTWQFRDYSLLGQRMCRNAFIICSGIIITIIIYFLGPREPRDPRDPLDFPLPRMFRGWD